LRFDPTEEQTQAFVARLEKLIDRITALPQLSSEQRQVLSKARASLAAATHDEDLNLILDALREEFGSLSILRRAFRGRLRGEPASPGKYLVQLHVGDEIYPGTITVRSDPMLPSSN
jgi:hypothetical protein